MLMSAVLSRKRDIHKQHLPLSKLGNLNVETGREIISGESFPPVDGRLAMQYMVPSQLSQPRKHG